ncbi:MAG: DUF4864 domain-containing protein [Rhizobiaceae bacterium]|nr:DUF4864 domain-containing protein [Rhizobiaceae bacterium]
MRSRLSPLAFALCLAASLMAGPAAADDAADIKTVISGQLQAFKAGDGAAAYSFAAPNVKAMFPNADMFMTMVEGGYAPVFRSSNATFGELKAEGSGFRQEVNLTDPSGQSHIASYTLERQPDGSLKITGCSIRKGDDLAA